MRHSSRSSNRNRRCKRGGKVRGCRAGKRKCQTKSERLSKKNFRICFWNCASACRRGAVLERLVHDFDVICLQETRTTDNKRIPEIPGFKHIQKHEGRGTAILYREELHKTTSKVNLNKWSNDHRELMGIRLQKPDQRHNNLVLINAYIHQKTHHAAKDWDFIQDIENEFGDTVIICGDLNARANMWDDQGTNPQGTALEDALQSCQSIHIAPSTPTHIGARQGDSDSTIDLALISPRLKAWANIESLEPHGSDHLPVVLSLQMPAQQPKTLRSKNPFKYDRRETGVVARLRTKANQANTGKGLQKKTK